MGNKNKFNRKGREIIETVVDNTETSKIKVILHNEKETFDDSNLLVLPSKKRPVIKKKNVIQKTKLLSKTQRKKLQKIVEKKKKTANRSSLLEALSKVQASTEELSQLTSVASVQTRGLKRHFIDFKHNGDNFDQLNKESMKIEVNNISGSKRRKRILTTILAKNSDLPNSNPNVVGFDDYDSSASEEFDELKETKAKTNSLETKNKEKEKSNNISEEFVELKETEVKILSLDIKNEEKGESSTLNKSSCDNIIDNKKICKEKKIEGHNQTVKKDYKLLNPSIFVPVDRDEKVQKERLKLPILSQEQEIVEAVNENSVIIVAGETGSGKTTQVPQFLYEAGYARNNKIIGVTQPRRVAAISMSKRVSEEMNLGLEQVSYLIRFEGNAGEKTKIKFMTDGVLLKEVQSDFTLSKYSVIILDEAHERSVYTDILIGLLSRIVPLRNKKNDPLKLIIMSATLRVEDFTQNTRLFKTQPPVIQVETRQYPVTVYFNKRTPYNYLTECFLKACKIHTKLPEGGILIFVTGQSEVNFLVKKLRKHFPYNKTNKENDFDINCKKFLENIRKNRKNRNNISRISINLDKYSVVPNDDTEVDILEDDLELFSEDDDFSDDIIKISNNQPLWVLPMYSLLSSTEQAKVFNSPPEGCRLCIVSTNIAETSLTIPNIKYVVDSGKTKTKLYDKTTGVTSFNISWCSKASANQRAGRAGRMGPGYCYRLYSSAVFNDEFPQFSVPEIQQKPVDDLILQMKSMNIVKVLSFPFPTSPDILQIKSGEKRLQILGALEKSSEKGNEWSSKLTKLGETMVSFPVSPRFAKMLALSYQQDLLQYTVCIVAALSVQEVFLSNCGEKKWSQIYRSWAGVGNSFLLGDIMVLLRAVGAAEYSRDNLEEFCLKNGLRLKAIIEIRKLRVQLVNQINLSIPELNLVIDSNLKPPSDIQAKLLRQIVLSGLADHVAHKINSDEIKSEEKNKWKQAYRDSEMEEPIFLHSSSVFKKNMPDWVVYQEVYETKKLYMRGVTAIEPEWLPIFVPSLCNMSEPLLEPPPRYNPKSGEVFFHVSGTFGRAAFTLPVMEIPLPNSIISYKWFAKFLLEGEVFPKLRKYKESLLSFPAVMTKPWAKLQPRTEKLLKALTAKEANNRDQLLNIWKDDSYYLLEAYKAWLPESAHESITLIWPPL